MADDTRASSSGSSGELAERSGRPELPPLRVRGSLAARIVALVMLVVLGTATSALIIVEGKEVTEFTLDASYQTPDSTAIRTVPLTVSVR